MKFFKRKPRAIVPDNVKTTKLNIFHPFSRLPPELRIAIWEYAFIQPRQIEYRVSDQFLSRSRSLLPAALGPAPADATDADMVLAMDRQYYERFLVVNHEARAEFLRLPLHRFRDFSYRSPDMAQDIFIYTKPKHQLFRRSTDESVPYLEGITRMGVRDNRAFVWNNSVFVPPYGSNRVVVKLPSTVRHVFIFKCEDRATFKSPVLPRFLEDDAWRVERSGTAAAILGTYRNPASQDTFHKDTLLLNMKKQEPKRIQ